MARPIRGRGGYPPPPQKDLHRINENIRATTVRLIDSDGGQLGIKTAKEALSIAKSKSLDLVEIAAQASPPVCKLMLYSKFKYEQEKKKRDSKKHQKSGLLKEVRFSPVIGTHDLEVKIKHAEEFIKANDKVRFTVLFRGRQNQHKDIGLRLLQGVAERLKEIASIEQRPTTDRNRMMMTLAPKH